MKIQLYFLYTFVLCLFLSVLFSDSASKSCSKLGETACKASKGSCRWVSGQTCEGKFQRFCVTDGGKCKSKSTCATSSSSSTDYYKYLYNCLPSGWKEQKSKKCDCKIKPPASPPGQNGSEQTYCNSLPYDACEAQTANCFSRTGNACGNLQYTFCRGKDRPCNFANTCWQEPASGINYYFKLCVPDNWISEPNSSCVCSSTTTNQCPQCPPGYQCDPNGPNDSSNCFSITVPVLPPSAPTPPDGMFRF